MSIFVDKDTRLLVQGITGRDGSFHTTQMVKYGTNVVAGVTPGRGGLKVEGVPVFNSVAESVKKTDANTSVIFVPAKFAPDAIYESADAGIKLIICISEGIPAIEMVKVVAYVKDKGCRLIGPNSPGVVSAGEAKVGILPGHIFKKGSVGVVSRSGTLTYEIVDHITKSGLGQSTCLGIGGDPVIGTKFIECLELFAKDKDTEAVVLVGEIGGRDEQDTAVYVKQHFRKSVFGFIAGKTAPPGKRMGHAGAIIAGTAGTAAEKIKAFEENGIKVGETPADVARLVKEHLG
ncbi:succinyl-CoA synthetase subunit alpha [candidate division WOR_3 bacterium SM1_77]|jgi:succinyl-CoA synthetase alpha subunit|uniref:Succinate--CoA ligase [ADP-forming] subunit alpha n=1 Tax=candidate division WOR_3 bacterium SM1_77 TaxID=1703778 RepID=A0A0S8JYL8_UNCW3|nr:MAG: succinyl-CoA synthetase subunit alpha [candidate division WOR_3 bacterium SM1_77]